MSPPLHVKTVSVLLLFLVSVLAGCPAPLEEEARRPEEALRPVRFFYPEFKDDLGSSSLVQAIRRNFEYLERLDPGYVFRYGSDAFTCRDVMETQRLFLSLIRRHPEPEALNRAIKKNFRLYRAAGRAGNRKVLFTGYFQPVFEARLKPTETFRYPIYGEPGDLLKIDLSSFSEELAGHRIVARIDGKEVVPYFSRKQIDVHKALQGRGLEIAWLKNPVDVALLQIQGSGRLSLSGGKTISVGYKASNGRPYRSIGQYMLKKGYLTREEMSMQAIRRYLEEHPEAVDEVLGFNPSYVFFRVLENGPLGNIAVPVTRGRSLALDSRLFPKGALAFIKCQKPVIDAFGNIVVWEPFSRFVLNQDTGGAIRGAGRADLYWGSGEHARIAAGHMKHEGDLYLLIRKKPRQ